MSASKSPENPIGARKRQQRGFMVYLLKQLALTNVNDPAGRWQFEGGQVLQNKEHVANYASIKRVTFKGTDQNGQNTASVTTTLFYLGETNPPQNVTLEGAHDFSSGNETGSVSAASVPFAANIGKQYTRNGATNILTF
jgi:hypothetical protein